MTIIWFVIFLALLIIELMTVNLVSIWFALGALFAMFAAFFTDSIIVQGVVFVIVSVIAIILTKPLTKKFKGFKVEPTNSDRVIGKIGDVTKDILPNNYGEVKIFGNYWTAASESKIKAGSKVRIKAIDGVKLIVEEEEE